MSRRTSIVKSIADKLHVINGTQPYKTNLYNSAFAKLKFWDEIDNFPAIYVVAGSESREHLPASFTWCYLNVSLKVYTKGEDAQQLLEDLIEDIERVIGALSGTLVINDAQQCTADIYVTGITTDEGLLLPYAVGEVNLLVRYQLAL